MGMLRETKGIKNTVNWVQVVVERCYSPFSSLNPICDIFVEWDKYTCIVFMFFYKLFIYFKYIFLQENKSDIHKF